MACGTKGMLRKLCADSSTQRKHGTMHMAQPCFSMGMVLGESLGGAGQYHSMFCSESKAAPMRSVMVMDRKEALRHIVRQAARRQPVRQ